jgi:hypothetical protein
VPAPSNSRSDEEIIADIIKIVSYPPVRPLVRRRIKDLRDGALAKLKPFSGNQKENLEYMRGLRAQIIKLERTLKNPQSFLLKPRFWSLWGARGTAIEFAPHIRNYIAEDSPRLKQFAEELSWLRALCDEIIKFKPGVHGNVKQQHWHAANASYEVLEAVGSYTRTEPWPTDSPTGKLCRIATLFHEAATGEYDRDLREACRAVLGGKAKI